MQNSSPFIKKKGIVIRMKTPFLQLERGEGLRTRDVIGIFDFDFATRSEDTRAFLTLAQSEMRVVSLASDLPKSIVLADEAYVSRVYLSGLSAESVCKRL